MRLVKQSLERVVIKKEKKPENLGVIKNVPRATVKAYCREEKTLEEKESYNLKILYNNINAKVSLIDVNTNREVISKVIKSSRTNVNLTIKNITKGMPRDYVKILKPQKVNYSLKEIKMPTQKAVATPFMLWCKDKIEELKNILITFRYNYIIKNLDYKINSYTKKIIISIKVPTGGIIEGGIHKYILNYNTGECLYFFGRMLKAKERNIIDTFKDRPF